MLLGLRGPGRGVANVQHGDVNLISSKKKRLKKEMKVGDGNRRGWTQLATKKKAGWGGGGGVLWHPVLTLKKVARLPSKGRVEVMKVLKNTKVMKALKSKIHKCQVLRAKVAKSVEEVNQVSSNEASSSTSVNNDWKNWVTLNGFEKVVEDDIRGIGRVIGVSFNNETHNKFTVMSRSKTDSLGPVFVLEEVSRGALGGGGE